MSQTSVSAIGQPVAYAGLVSSAQEVIDKVSGFSEEASAPVRFGVAVMQGTARTGALLPAGSTTPTAPIKGVHSFNFEHSPGTYGDLDSTGTGVIPDGRLDVLRKGRVWVVIDQSITTIVPFSDRAYIRIAANGSNIILGAFSNVSDTSYSYDSTRQALFTSAVTTAADGTKIAEVEVDFTNRPT